MTADPMDPHALTLATADGCWLCKSWYKDGRVEGYASARLFDLSTILVLNLMTLERLLRDLIKRRNTCVLRGAVIDPQKTRGQRRLLHPDPKTGDAPTLQEAKRAWVALDIDGLPLPAGVDPRDLEACAVVMRSVLPPAFQDAACLVTATASHCIKPGARLRPWFLLDRPLSKQELKIWLKDAPVDHSVFGAVQPIYTAGPRFLGLFDPLPHRLVVLPGTERVVTPSATALMPPRPVRPAPQNLVSSPNGWSTQYGRAALVRAANAVLEAGEGNRHPTAVAEAWSLSRLVGQGLLSASELSRAIEGALRLAGKPAGEGAQIVAWALQQRGGGAA
ncbi:hypothetical protein E0493_19965 [Roseomonas sp. M0104]|uniref:Uncharacterized protein n=1 Tax=Teichococcus coralli TaxID=2545983 RepID=A0A845BQE8_9PROT|nr:hypothetical protein [Pseudoroseomonas coralli]MXP65629.1 hypothetical protein [Pseudoroseomonas coralli]